MHIDRSGFHMIGSHKASRDKKTREGMAVSNNNTFIVYEWKQRVNKKRPTTANGLKTFDRWVLQITKSRWDYKLLLRVRS